MSQYHRYNNTVAAVAAGNTSWSAVNSNDNNIHGYKAYIESPSSDWLLNTPRKVLMQYGCPKCCEENYKRRLAVTNNQDGTYTSHFVYCSITCVLFNKQQVVYIFVQISNKLCRFNSYF
jgi:hypothetical protein